MASGLHPTISCSLLFCTASHLVLLHCVFLASVHQEVIAAQRHLTIAVLPMLCSGCWHMGLTPGSWTVINAFCAQCLHSQHWENRSGQSTHCLRCVGSLHGTLQERCSVQSSHLTPFSAIEALGRGNGSQPPPADWGWEGTKGAERPWGPFQPSCAAMLWSMLPPGSLFWGCLQMGTLMALVCRGAALHPPHGTHPMTALTPGTALWR